MLSKAQQKENELNAELRQCQDELEATKVLCCTVYYILLLCVTDQFTMFIFMYLHTQSARDNLEQSKRTLEKQNSDLEKAVKKLTFKLEVRVEDLGKKEVGRDDSVLAVGAQL